MNYINQFIQLTVQEYVVRLGIKKPVMVCTDPKEWFEVFPNDRKVRMDKQAGGSQRLFNWIFINTYITDHKSLLELKETIIHELLHLKFPKSTEKQIQDLTNTYVELLK